jgi:hypothetical protein
MQKFKDEAILNACHPYVVSLGLAQVCLFTLFPLLGNAVMAMRTGHYPIKGQGFKLTRLFSASRIPSAIISGNFSVFSAVQYSVRLSATLTEISDTLTLHYLGVSQV